MNEQSPLLEWLDDVAFYRGLKVERKTVHIAGRKVPLADSRRRWQAEQVKEEAVKRAGRQSAGTS